MGRKINDFIVPLYDKEYERLVAIAYRRTNDWALAQDLVQNTFLLAIFNPEKVLHHPKPEAWLMQTLQNLIKSELRTPFRQSLPLDEAIEVPARAVGEPLDNILPEQLQGREREILIWRFEQNMSYNEMADRLGVSADLCRKWVSQAIIKCRRILRMQLPS